jgi:thiol:disulfide interchange protein DsbD
LKGYFEINEAEAAAAKANKPLFIDFTGHGCVNCREMEEKVLADPNVLKLLKEEYVVVALYTDDKTEAYEEDWINDLTTIGEINGYYQRTRFNSNAQPWYVLQGKDGKVLVEPRGYDLDVQEFIDFLKKGVEEYKKQ